MLTFQRLITNEIRIKGESLFNNFFIYCDIRQESQLNHNAVFALKSLPSWHNTWQGGSKTFRGIAFKLGEARRAT